MLMRRVSPKDKIPIGLRRTAGIAVVSVVAAASLGGIGAANATCVGFSGIDIGPGCTTTGRLSFAFVLGDGTADASGLFTNAIGLGLNDPAIAQSTGFFSLAYAGGGNTVAETQALLPSPSCKPRTPRRVQAVTPLISATSASTWARAIHH